jgi:sulfatase maturation enzyme AslB (radical SAM superfamily)
MNDQNPVSQHLEQIASTLQPLDFPTRFAVEVTAECNLACSMCHHPKMRRPKGRMPYELWQRCADQIADASPDTQCWFSFCGEPLLEPELLFKMLAYRFDELPERCQDCKDWMTGAADRIRS